MTRYHCLTCGSYFVSSHPTCGTCASAQFVRVHMEQMESARANIVQPAHEFWMRNPGYSAACCIFIGVCLIIGAGVSLAMSRGKFKSSTTGPLIGAAACIGFGLCWGLCCWYLPRRRQRAALASDTTPLLRGPQVDLSTAPSSDDSPRAAFSKEWMVLYNLRNEGRFRAFIDSAYHPDYKSLVESTGGSSTKGSAINGIMAGWSKGWRVHNWARRAEDAASFTFLYDITTDGKPGVYHAQCTLAFAQDGRVLSAVYRAA